MFSAKELCNLSIASTMDELLSTYERVKDDEQDRYECQLMVLIDKIRNIRSIAENGGYG